MLTVLLTILIAVNTAQSSESSTAELLEKGIYTEETVGDLGLAIEIYAQVVEQVSGERLHAGRALYRMGLCYQKIGDAKQAESTFQKLIADYPDQTDLVSLARQHLPDEQAGTVLEPAPWKDGEEAFQQPGILTFLPNTRSYTRRHAEPSVFPLSCPVLFQLAYETSRLLMYGSTGWLVNCYCTDYRHFSELA